MDLAVTILISLVANILMMDSVSTVSTRGVDEHGLNLARGHSTKNNNDSPENHNHAKHGHYSLENYKENTENPKHEKHGTLRQWKTVDASKWPVEWVKFAMPIQSPIDLVTSKAITRADLPILDIIDNMLDGVKATVVNSGSTVYVLIDEHPILRPYLTGGPLKDKFVFEQMHFHWGFEDIWGSEHFIDGESFAVEIHMVHWNNKYGSYHDAKSNKPDGLCVLTVFAEACDEDNPLLVPLFNLLHKIESANSSAHVAAMDAMQWPVSALSLATEYYTYPGSLTTWPYTEYVTFILVPQPIKMSHAQLSAFRKLHKNAETLILDNKRKLQPLHDRPIVRSTKMK